MALTRIQTAALQSSITGSNITDGSIAAADLASGSVTPAKLSTGGPNWDASSNVTIAGALSAISPYNTQNALMTYLLPSVADGWRGIYRSGFDWWSRNQQWGGPWGGELADTATGTLYKIEVATGFQRTTHFGGTYCGDASRMNLAQGFKIPESQTVSNIWIRIHKDGNPTDNLGLYIYSDSSGTPSALITNGTATAISGKLMGVDRGWYRFNFPTPPSLTGGTQYHIVLRRSGSADSSNIYSISSSYPNGSATEYPFGAMRYADATPTWASASTDRQINFLVELSATGKILQSGGQFEDKAVFGGTGAASTISMSRGLVSNVPLRELVNVNEFTSRFNWTGGGVKDQTLFDIGSGENSNRIVLRCQATTGYGGLYVYDNTGTIRSALATTVDLSAGTNDIGVYVRAQNDGADRLDLFINGTTYSTTTLSIPFDTPFQNLGCMYLGGGFALAPTYSAGSIPINGFSALPNALSPAHTYAGQTIGNVFSVSGGKLYQNARGDNGNSAYFAYAWGASNANGHSLVSKVQQNYVTGDSAALAIVSDDGTKRHYTYINGHWATYNKATNVKLHFDFRQPNELAYRMKGVDAHLYINQRLQIDGTNDIATGSSNGINYGNWTSGADRISDVIYSSMNFYTGGPNFVTFANGSLNEFACWKGNQKTLWSLLYNSGTFISVKQFCGIDKNYGDQSTKLPVIIKRNITDQPSSTSANYTRVPEMETYVVGDSISTKFQMISKNSSTNQMEMTTVFDGVHPSVSVGNAFEVAAFIESTTNFRQTLSLEQNKSSYLGLHLVTGVAAVDAGTQTFESRSLTVGAKL